MISAAVNLLTGPLDTKMMNDLPPLTYPVHPLNFLPITQLTGDFSNFREWSYAVQFHLRYFKLTEFVNKLPKKPKPLSVAERESLELRSLHAYSIIASNLGGKGVSEAFAQVHDRWTLLP